MLLESLDISRLPLRYGTEACCLQLCDSSHSREILELRNSDLGPFINRIQVTEEEHEQWMKSRSERLDILDFVILIQGRFGGTVSLTDIERGRKCEFGRMIIPNDGRRIYTLAVEFLGMSFAFQILGLQEIYCAVVESNESIKRLHLRNRWELNPAYDRNATVNGAAVHLLGLSVRRADWPECFAAMKPFVTRLLDTDSSQRLFQL